MITPSWEQLANHQRERCAHIATLPDADEAPDRARLQYVTQIQDAYEVLLDPVTNREYRGRRLG